METKENKLNEAFKNLKFDESTINSLNISNEDKNTLIEMLDKKPEEIEKIAMEMLERNIGKNKTIKKDKTKGKPSKEKGEFNFIDEFDMDCEKERTCCSPILIKYCNPTNKTAKEVNLLDYEDLQRHKIYAEIRGFWENFDRCLTLFKAANFNISEIYMRSPNKEQILQKLIIGDKDFTSCIKSKDMLPIIDPYQFQEHSLVHRLDNDLLLCLEAMPIFKIDLLPETFLHINMYPKSSHRGLYKTK